MDFQNAYNDPVTAGSYAKLQNFPNTYHLAYRDLPVIIKKHVKGDKAIDFGCGAGRSTRFLKGLGFEVIGIDISQEMVARARKFDPRGDYQVVANGKYSHLGMGKYDLVQSIFTFDNIPGMENRAKILKGLAGLLHQEGSMLLLDSNPDMYVNEWASFTTKDYPENRNAKSGDKVLIVNTDMEDRRPVEDIYWTVHDYHEMFNQAGLVLVKTYKPLGRPDEPFKWINEESIPPWFIYILRKDML